MAALVGPAGSSCTLALNIVLVGAGPISFANILASKITGSFILSHSQSSKAWVSFWLYPATTRPASEVVLTVDQSLLEAMLVLQYLHHALSVRRRWKWQHTRSNILSKRLSKACHFVTVHGGVGVCHCVNSPNGSKGSLGDTI